jgi:hypothetical protein
MSKTFQVFSIVLIVVASLYGWRCMAVEAVEHGSAESQRMLQKQLTDQMQSADRARQQNEIYANTPEGRAEARREKAEREKRKAAYELQQKEEEKQRRDAIERRRRENTRTWTWTDESGIHRITAEFVFVVKDSVKLRKEDSSIVALPLTQLGKQDQQWIRDSSRRIAGNKVEKSFRATTGVGTPVQQDTLRANGTTKHSAKLSGGDDVSDRTRQYLGWKPLEVGDVGRVEYCTVIQIVDDNNAIVEIGYYPYVSFASLEKDTVWLKNSTRNMVDGRAYTDSGYYKITGTKRYETVVGGTKTMFVLEPTVKPISKVEEEGKEAVVPQADRTHTIPKKAESNSDIDRLVGKWKVSVGSYRATWAFFEDGTVTSTAGTKKGTWKLEPSAIRIAWEAQAWETFDRPLDAPNVVGDSWQGKGLVKARKVE